MKRVIKILLVMAVSAVTASINFVPAFAAGTYDDEGNYFEYEEYDPYEDEEDPESEFYASFSTSWFTDHPNRTEYTITTATQLKGLADLVNESRYDSTTGTTRYQDFEGITIRLGRDITLRDNFTPIGRSDESSFKGVFDGNGHTISDLNVRENGGYAGLFGYLDGTIKNLRVLGSVKSSGAVCGSVAGYVSANGIIRNCTSGVSVKGKAKTGGIAGHNDGGTITGCINTGSVSGTMKVGGIAGENWGSVIQCGNRGEVRSSERGATTYGTGGVCGRSVSPDSVIDRCFNTGDIISETEGTGGVCGYMNARKSRIKSSYNTGTIRVKNNTVLNTDNIRGFAGGIVGIAGVEGVLISDCYNAGQIINTDTSGGIIGSYLNESEFEEEGFIVNNYYLNASGLRGIGSDHSGKAQNLREGTEKMAQATLINGAAKLGSAYIEDSQSYYGADGYPVLRWQKSFGTVESTRLTCIPDDTQKQYDRYLQKNPASKRAEWPVMIFFDYSLFTSNAIGDFNEK